MAATHYSQEVLQRRVPEPCGRSAYILVALSCENKQNIDDAVMLFL